MTKAKRPIVRDEFGIKLGRDVRQVILGHEDYDIKKFLAEEEGLVFSAYVKDLIRRDMEEINGTGNALIEARLNEILTLLRKLNTVQVQAQAPKSNTGISDKQRKAISNLNNVFR